MILKIVQIGDPVLRQEAGLVDPKRINTPEFARLVELMRATMLDAPGVGLAAPQVGVPLRLTVIEDREEYLERMAEEDLQARERQAVPFQVLINPKLTVIDATPVTFVEGCLSVAGFAAQVPRARAVRVEALDHKGQPQVIEAKGWYARILQHEIDHLNGQLYIDHMNTRTFVNMMAAQGR